MPKRQETGLFREGPYRYLRHPMYAGTFLEGIGVCVACFSISHFLSFALFIILAVGYFVLVYKEAILLEEEKLFADHGHKWDDYARRVPALLPVLEDLRWLSYRDIMGFRFNRFENTGEWKGFAAFLGVFAFLWFKLVYRL